ncbi:MAG: hypothetical protein WCB15_35465 [Desulfobacterales bacterium]|jgi:hypothetical protein
MAKPKTCRSYEFTGDVLDHDGEFKKFFRGLSEYLKGKLQRIEVKGSRHNYNQYTCGQLHDKRNPEWRKLENLWEFCEEAEFDPYAAIDAIEERIGVKLECDCQIVNNEFENRRKALANAFGADLGEAGWDFDFY